MTLKAISINVLIAFFNWLLCEQKVGAASTLQTYWNVFCLFRKKETGCLEIDPLIKTQMHGVRHNTLSTIYPHANWYLGQTTVGPKVWLES